MPQSLAPGGVLAVWFSTSLISADAGGDHGYQVTFANSSVRQRARTKQEELIVKATDQPAPGVNA